MWEGGHLSMTNSLIRQRQIDKAEQVALQLKLNEIEPTFQNILNMWPDRGPLFAAQVRNVVNNGTPE